MANVSIQQSARACYVYEIVVDGVVRYIGKGTGRRAAVHIGAAEVINKKRLSGARVRASQFYNRLAKALRKNSTVEYRIVNSGLSSEAAFAEEVVKISDAPVGQLWNELPGGLGGDAEYSRTVVKAQWDDPKFRAARIASMRASNTPSKHLKVSNSLRLRWSDPAYREQKSLAIRAACNTPEVKQKRSVSSKKMWDVPGARERYGLAISSGQKASTKFASAWNSQQYRENHRKSLVDMWARSPERLAKQKARMLEKASDLAYKEKQREAMKALWADPIFREKMVAKRRAR